MLARRLAAILVALAVMVSFSGCRSYSQTYWYCWDSGTPQPHHLGHPVSGDHYCTDAELEDAGLR